MEGILCLLSEKSSVSRLAVITSVLSLRLRTFCIETSSECILESLWLWQCRQSGWALEVQESANRREACISELAASFSQSDGSQTGWPVVYKITVQHKYGKCKYWGLSVVQHWKQCSILSSKSSHRRGEWGPHPHPMWRASQRAQGHCSQPCWNWPASEHQGEHSRNVTEHSQVGTAAFQGAQQGQVEGSPAGHTGQPNGPDALGCQDGGVA